MERIRKHIAGGPYYTFNLTKAEAILDAAGYTKTFDLDGTLYRFNGTTLRLFYNAGNSEREKMAVMFQSDLDSIGILSSIIAEGWPQLLHRMYTTDDWDTMFIGWGPDYNDPDDYIFPFIASTGIGGDTYNTGYYNATVDAGQLRIRQHSISTSKNRPSSSWFRDNTSDLGERGCRTIPTIPYVSGTSTITTRPTHKTSLFFFLFFRL